MNDGGLKACVKRGAAYAVLMEGLYPDIRQVYFDPADLDDVVKKLRKGDCHAYVDVRASLEIVAGLSRFCEHGLAMPGEPIASGPQDMAVGGAKLWLSRVPTCRDPSPRHRRKCCSPYSSEAAKTDSQTSCCGECRAAESTGSASA